MIAKIEDSQWYKDELSEISKIGNLINGLDISMNFFVVDDIFTPKKREISQVSYNIKLKDNDDEIIKFLLSHGYNFKRNTNLRNGFRNVSYMKEKFI